LDPTANWGSIEAGVFDPDRRLIAWTFGAVSLVLHLDRLDVASRRGGWIRWTHPDTVAFAASSTAIYAGGDVGVRELHTATTTDAGQAFAASIQFRPLTGESLTGRFGILKGALVTGGAAQTVNLTVTQDFVSTELYDRDIACDANDYVVDVDDLSLSDCETFHLTVGDGATVTNWTLDQIHLRPTGGAQ
jgi:hypothetical protein